jgi:hypothetical protein
MPEYRLYTVEHGNQFSGPPVVLQCDSDQDAIAEARKLLDGLDIEVWRDTRMVIRLTPSDANPGAGQPA